MKKNIIEIRYNNKLYALIIKEKRKFVNKGVDFVTNEKDLLQLGFINHSKGHIIQPHKHLKKIRMIKYCTEVLIVEKGRMKIKFYDNKNRDIKKDKILNKGDIIILFQGGHGFDVLAETKIIEIKQGPYIEGKDKNLIKS